MKRILVTGGTGFIGSHLVQRLSELDGIEVFVYSNWQPSEYQLQLRANYIHGDLDDAELLLGTLKKHRIDLVYHLAWNSIHETSLQNTAQDLESNLLGTVNLLEACRLSGIRRIIFMSSGGTVYGLPGDGSVNEDHPTYPICAYGVTKLAAEKYLNLYQHMYGLEHVIIRPSVPYGPGQDPTRRQGAVSVFIHRALSGKPVTIWGDGSSVRDYFFISDMIEPLIQAMYVPAKENNIFNRGGAIPYSLTQLVNTIEETLNLKLAVTNETERSFDVPKLTLDSSKATRHLSWQPSTTLAEGIRLTAQWQRKHSG